MTNEKLFGAKHILLQQKGASNIEIKDYHENGVEGRGAGNSDGGDILGLL